jgi:hypothetical protein
MIDRIDLVDKSVPITVSSYYMHVCVRVRVCMCVCGFVFAKEPVIGRFHLLDKSVPITVSHMKCVMCAFIKLKCFPKTNCCSEHPIRTQKPLF